MLENKVVTASQTTDRDPVDVIADALRFFRLNPEAANAAMPNVDPDHFVAKEICDRLFFVGGYVFTAVKDESDV